MAKKTADVTTFTKLRNKTISNVEIEAGNSVILTTDKGKRFRVTTEMMAPDVPGMVVAEVKEA